MLNANLILISFLVYILLRNHFPKTNGAIFAIICILTAYVKVLAEAFSIAEFEKHPFILNLVLLQGVIGFLPIPFVLLFLRSTLIKTRKLNWNILAMFIPFVFCIINLIPYFGIPIQEKIDISTKLTNAINQNYFIWISLPTINMISNIYNPISALIMLIFLGQKLVQNWNKLGKKTHANLLQMGVIFIVNYITLSAITYYKILNINHIEPDETMGMLAMILPLSFLLFPNLIYDLSINSELTYYVNKLIRISSQEEKNEIINDELRHDADRIINFLYDEKPYLNPGFSIHDVVSRLDIPQKNVRECFNQIIKIPFPKMRNQLRIAFAIEMFKQNSHATISIEGIASESGFNNRATFYQAFREVTNMTPVQWIKENCDHSDIES